MRRDRRAIQGSPGGIRRVHATSRARMRFMAENSYFNIVVIDLVLPGVNRDDGAVDRSKPEALVRGHRRAVNEQGSKHQVAIGLQ